MMFETMWAVDVEGNGGSPAEIVELAVVELRDIMPTGRSFRWLVRPTHPVTVMATRIHGMTNADLASCPPIRDVIEEMMSAIDGQTILGHNVRVDLDALKRAIPTFRPRAAIDTLRLARRLRPGLSSYALSSLASELELDPTGFTGNRKGHSAEYDASLAAALARILLMDLSPERQATALREADILGGQAKLPF